MATYGKWEETIEIDGKNFRADRIASSYAERAGVTQIFAIDGLPSSLADTLVRSAQVCDVPHTWRVQEVESEDQVSAEVLAKGNSVLQDDMEQLNAHIITYVTEREDGDFEFLAAGAIRDKLTRDFHNPLFPVVSRAIVAPQHRGKGLGTLIVEHRMTIVLRGYFGPEPHAIHFGTESSKILHVIKKVEQAEKVAFVHIGDEQLATAAGTHTVNDYLCYMPKYQEKLLTACDTVINALVKKEAMVQFKEKLALFTAKGVKAVLGAELESLLQQANNSLTKEQAADETIKEALHLLREFFIVRETIGAVDP